MHWSHCEFSMNVTRGFVILSSPLIDCFLNFTSLSHFPHVNITSRLFTRQVYRPSNRAGKSSPSCKLNSYMSDMYIRELAETQPSTVHFRSTPGNMPKSQYSVTYPDLLSETPHFVHSTCNFPQGQSLCFVATCAICPSKHILLAIGHILLH